MQIMKIINMSPESFSNDYQSNEKLYKNILNSNIDIYDIGGQSTKPGFDEISAFEEWNRVKNTIEYLSTKDVVMSIDSYKIEVIEKALKKGVKIINNVSHMNIPSKNKIIKLMKKYDAEIVIMHPFQCQNIEQIQKYLFTEVDFYMSKGIDSEKIIIDPGYGYGKRDSLLEKIYNDMSVFEYKNVRTLIGLSRKSSIQRKFNLSIEDDLLKLDKISWELSVNSKANIIRVHTVGYYE